MSRRCSSWFVRPKVAIVLFNLGGPDSPEAIRPFLLNLFNDPAILRVPFFVRPFLARKITSARLQPATAAYRLLGGKSPLTETTQAQAEAIAAALPELDAKCFVAMRYWHPFSLEAARAVKAWQPDEIVLLPLYPQYSTTTTGSSLTAWREAAARAGLMAPTSALCCFPTDPEFIAATLSIVQNAYETARTTLDPATPLRILFSAHGLPEAIVRGGDPYQYQIEQTVAALLAAWRRNDLDWKICYQSRATPQQWITPSTDAEITLAGHERTAVLVVPIAVVSEHSETLVELDIDYKELAHRAGVPAYFRVPTQQLDRGFIVSLANLVRFARHQGVGLHAACDSAACSGCAGSWNRQVSAISSRRCPRRARAKSAAVDTDQIATTRRKAILLYRTGSDHIPVSVAATGVTQSQSIRRPAWRFSHLFRWRLH
jgi:ferrochelatase